MTYQEIQDKIYEYIQETYDLGEDDLYTPDVNLFDYGYLNSMDAVAVIAWLEEEFDVEISQKDIILYPMNTVEEIAQVVADKLD